MGDLKPEEFAIGERQPSDPDQPHAQPRSPRPNHRARSVIALLLILGAIPFLWGGVSIALQYLSCKWPSTEGKIISQYYREFPYDLKHRIKPAQLEIRYAYTVAGTSYESERFSLWQSIYQDPDAMVRAFAAQHPKGTPITVYYKPGNPKKAVLQTGPNWRGDFALMLGGALLAFVALLMKLLLARAAQAKARARLQSRS
jgi:Protein of unknown function (DUF3592)